MDSRLKFKKNLIEKLEIGITFLLLTYYLGINISTPLTQAWALFGFLTIPLLILANLRRFLWVVTRDLILLLLIITVPISVLWSTSSADTLAYSRAFLSSVGFGIYLAVRYTPKVQIQFLFWLFSIATFLNFVVPLIAPSYGIDFTYQGGAAWQGITRHKNELSAAMAMISSFFLTFSIYGSKYRWATFFGAGLAFLLLLLSKGKGSLGMFIGLLPLLVLYKIAKQEYRLRTFLTISTFIIGIVIAIVTLFNIEFIVVDINGRDQLWNYLVSRGLERPWLGYGYAGFWSNLEEGLGVAVRFPWIVGAGEGGGNSHSSYIEVFLQLGFLGLSLVVLSFSIVLARVILLLGLTRQKEYFWMLQSLLMLAITAYYEAYGGFLAYRHIFWILYTSYAYTSAIHCHRIFHTGNKLANLKKCQ